MLLSASRIINADSNTAEVALLLLAAQRAQNILSCSLKDSVPANFP